MTIIKSEFKKKTLCNDPGKHPKAEARGELILEKTTIVREKN